MTDCVASGDVNVDNCPNAENIVADIFTKPAGQSIQVFSGNHSESK